jgi:uncharacterized SAM-binding protein YcdF (DUF218 family)
VAFVRRHLLVWVVLLVGLAALVVVGVTGFAVWRAAHTDDATRVGHADVIVVLGAAEYDGTPSPVFQGRLEQAAHLYHAGFAGSVVVLGGKEPGDRTTEGAAGAAWLVAHGLPQGSVFAEPVGRDTLQSMQAAAGFMRAHAMHSAFLVSDPWHNLRIARIAGDLGIRGYVSATWHSAATSTWTRLQGYVRETFAYLQYRLTHL